MNAFSGFGPAIAAGRSGHGAVSMALASGRVQLVNIRQESLTLARWRVLWIALGFAFVALLALVLPLAALLSSAIASAVSQLGPIGLHIAGHQGTPLAAVGLAGTDHLCCHRL